MDFGPERGSVVYLTLAVPLLAALACRTWHAMGKPTASPPNACVRLCVLTAYGGTVGAVASVWAHALPCWQLTCDMSDRDNVAWRVHILCFVGPFVAAFAVAYAASGTTAVLPSYDPLPPSGVPWIEGVRISHVPPRWAGPMPARGNPVMGTLP